LVLKKEYEQYTIDTLNRFFGIVASSKPEVFQKRYDEDNRIIDAKFKTFGCGSAIAASSLATEWLKGKSLDEAVTIDNMDLVEELNLPPVKIHCSVLAEDAIKSAINDYRSKNNLEILKFEN
jgi:nitrogen fixation NifU-like protein